MNVLDKLNLSRGGNDSKSEPSDINMRSVISVGVVLVVGMCFAFILGILVGRGYRPENAVPQLANVMPTTEPAHADESKDGEPKALKPEDLTFMDGLQNKGKEVEVVTDSTQKGPAEPKKVSPGGLRVHDLNDAPAGHQSPPPAHPIPPVAPAVAAPAKPAPVKPAPQAKPAKPAPQAKPDKPAKPTAAPSVEPKKPFAKSGGVRYRAVYQVASFPGKQQAETMAKRLAGKGIAVSIREGKSKDRKVFRVDIRLSGTEADITEALRRTGEKGPILLEKKPL